MNCYALPKSSLVTQTRETLTNVSLEVQYDYFQPYGVFALICCNILILVVTLPLNIYVLWLIRSGAGTGVKSEFFVLNLCVCEIVVSLTAIPNIVDILSLSNDVITPLNSVLAFLYSLHVTGCPFFQCCICVERYLAVVHPVIFLKFKPLRYRITFSTLSWLIVLGIGVSYPFVPFGRVFYILLPQYLLIFSVKVMCSIAVLKALRRPKPGETLSVSDSKANSMKKKAFVLIMIILVFMVFTYGPVLVFMFMFDSLTDNQKYDGINMFSFLLVLGGFVQPFLYLHRVGKLSFIRGLSSCCNKC